MAIWIEIHCDKRIRPAHPLAPVCHAHRGDQPGALAHNTGRAVDTALRMLAAEAIERGYRKRGTEWVCPVCLAAEREEG